MCSHGHLTFSYFYLLVVCSWWWWPSSQGSYVPARLKVPSEQVILCWECVISESHLRNFPFICQIDNYNSISKNQIQDLRASFHSSSPRPLAENSHKPTFKKKSESLSWVETNDTETLEIQCGWEKAAYASYWVCGKQMQNRSWTCTDLHEHKNKIHNTFKLSCMGKKALHN